MESSSQHGTTTYNVLHSENLPHAEMIDADDIDDDDEHDYTAVHHTDHHMKKQLQESFDFNDNESLMWRKVGISRRALLLLVFLILNISNYLYSINSEDIFKEKGNFGRLLE
jgi:hypothetical protein